MSPAATQRVRGHSDIGATAALYGGGTDAALREAADAVVALYAVKQDKPVAERRRSEA